MRRVGLLLSPRTLTAQRLTLLLAFALGGCRAATVRRPYQPLHEREAPSGALSMAWRLDVHQHELFEPAPEECSTAVLVGRTLVLGSRARTLLGVNADYGQVTWRQSVGVQLDSEGVYDAKRNQVLVGANDGQLFAVDPERGTIKWRFKGEGGIINRPEVADDKIFFTTNRGRLYALAAQTGQWLWDYERERPEEFTIHGQAVPKLIEGRVYAGFSDGFLVALHPSSGEVEWARSLASASDQYVDVDTTAVHAGDLVIAGSHSGGLYGLHLEDGTVKWRLAVEGAGHGTLVGTTLYFAAPRDGLHAVDALTGQVLWRRSLAGAGSVTAPQSVGPYLIFAGSRSGIYVVDRHTGQLRQTFFPGRGMCAAPTLDEVERKLYALSNGGTLYAFNLEW